MPFQSQVNLNFAPGVVGRRASMNPLATVVAGPGSLTAGPAGTSVGKFAWNSYALPGGPGVANSFSPAIPAVPDGFVANEGQCLITTWLAESTMIVSPGLPITEYEMGDFWAKNVGGEAALGNKVFANLFSGDILCAATGAFPTTSFGSVSVGLATLVAGSYTMIVTTGTSGVVAVGQLVTMVGLPAGTFVESLGNYNGSTGTVYLSQVAIASETTKAFTTSLPAGTGGAVASSASCSSGSPTMTVTTLTSGAVAVGMLVSGTSIPANTYISAMVSGNGGNGTVVTLSANATGAISTAAINFGSWIETEWYALTPGNVGDLIKIGKHV